MSDQLLKWHNAAYSVYYNLYTTSSKCQSMESESISRGSIYIKIVYKHYTVADMKVKELT